MSATWPVILEPSMAHTRQRPLPLHEMPHMWQPNLHQHKVYHSSHCDIAQAGWRKWAAEHPDMYARRADAVVPDWYTRRQKDIQDSDTKRRLWSWEKTDLPTEKRAFGIRREEPRPVQRGTYNSGPHFIEGQVRMPKHGLYHPPHYQQPSGVEPLPPLHLDMKNM